MDIKSGKDEVEAPTYSHLVYDVVPDEKVVVRSPDIVIIEGLNVLQPARARDDGRTGLAISDFFDFSVYVDAATADIRRWYVDRFLRLRETAFRNPASYFARYGEPHRGRGGRRGAPDLGRGQRPQPQAERAADPRPRHPGAAQVRRPLGPLRPPPQALTRAVLEVPDELRHQRHRLEAQPGVDADHLRVDLGVLGVHLGQVRPLALQPAQVGDLDRGAEPVPAVVAVHQGGPLHGPGAVRADQQVGVRDGLAVA